MERWNITALFGCTKKVKGKNEKGKIVYGMKKSRK